MRRLTDAQLLAGLWVLTALVLVGGLLASSAVVIGWGVIGVVGAVTATGFHRALRRREAARAAASTREGT